MSATSAHAEKILSVLNDGLAPARSAVAASWRRSLTLYGLDPEDHRPPDTLSEAKLKSAREEMGGLIHAAQATLDRLYAAVGSSGCCVLLTNRDGAPVERRGHSADDEVFHRWGLWVGADWSEAREGTNGIGTCLAEGRPLTIHRDQHFHSRNIGMSCTVAPIFDHQGRLAAALDVSSCRTDLTEAMLPLITSAVIDAARAIEAQHFRHTFSHARIVLAPERERTGTALLAVDRDDLIVGATREARVALGVTDACIAAQRPASDVLEVGQMRFRETRVALPCEDLHEAERGAVRRALARSEGNVTAAARALGVSRATLHRKMNRLGLHSDGRT